MTELTRSLLAAAREGLAPDAAVAARVRAKVAAAVGTASATGAAAAIPTAKAGSASLLVKLGAALLVVGAVGVGAVVQRSAPAPEAPRFVLATSEPDEVRTDVRVASANESLLVPAAAGLAPQEHHAPAGSAPGSAAAPAAVRAVEPASLSREVELIDLAMVSLRKHAPGAAIEAIRVFDRETQGHGQMGEDAAAIAIEAHCALGDDVSDALARFDRTWPSSAQRERIQTACFSR